VRKASSFTDMGGRNSKALSYYAPDGNLIIVKSQRQAAKAQYSFVSAHDGYVNSGDECYLINAEWIENWTSFVTATSKNPGVIDNHKLCDISGKDESLTATMKSGLLPKTDFRPINKTMWEYFYGLYGGGPVLVLFVPENMTPKQYQNGSWVKHCDIAALVTVIIPSLKPKQFVRKVKPTNQEEIAQQNTNMIANNMLHDLGKSKMASAKKLDGEINQSNAESIAMHMNRDLGKKKMEEARKMDAEVNAGNAEIAASLFAGEMANKALREAKQKEEEQNKAAMEAAANIMGAAISSQKLREAKDADERAKMEQTRNLLSAMSRMGAKTRFKEALKNKLMDVAEEAAACMLQCAWRGKLAQRKMLAQRAHKQRMLEEGYARKLQCAYRARLARRRAERLKEEKRILKEYGYARKLQNAWRRKKSRDRVNQLKAERQRLREEGCALIVQSSWRIRKAKRKAAALKAERQRLREEGAALMLQSAWRIKQARRKMGGLRQARDDEIKRKKEEEERKLAHATLIITKLLLRLACRLRLRRTVSQYPQIFRVFIHKAVNLQAADITGTSDPYVFVAGVSAGQTVSLYKTKYKSMTLNPVWDEEAYVCHVRRSDSIVLTVVDNDLVGSHDFLGQVSFVFMRTRVRVTIVGTAGRNSAKQDLKGVFRADCYKHLRFERVRR
jgi:hypothetical protein